MSAGLIFSLLVGIATLCWGLDRALRSIRDAKIRYGKLVAKMDKQVMRIKKVALETLTLKRELRNLNYQQEELEKEVEKLVKLVQGAIDPALRIFVLDERKVAADQGWIVTLTAPTGASARNAPWTGDRRFLVWAVGDEVARAKAYRKYPENMGFRIVSATQRKAAGTKAAAPNKAQIDAAMANAAKAS